MTTANRHSNSSTYYEFKKDKGETKKSSKPSKALTKESVATFAEEPLHVSGKSTLKEKKGSSIGMVKGIDLH